ncbi:MAG: alcohol dehydrogenase catalytic domain-containing protein [Acidobacteriota bacterium]
MCGEINLACGECEWCKRKLGRHCPTRTVMGIVKHPGSFREYLTLPVRNLHRVPRLWRPKTPCSPNPSRPRAKFWIRSRSPRVSLWPCWEMESWGY